MVGFFIEGAGVSEEETPAIVGIERDDEIFTVCRWKFGFCFTIKHNVELIICSYHTRQHTGRNF